MQQSPEHLRSLLFNRYDPIFNFYFAKNITDLCTARSNSSQVILFEEYIRFDCEDQMLKRFYNLNEVARINLLAQYYQRSRVLPSETPLLFLTTGQKPMFKRMKRRVKRLAKSKQMDEKQHLQEYGTFLKSIHSDQLQEQEPNLLEDLSMETTTYDIYQNASKESGMFQVAKGLFSLNEVENNQIGEVPEELVIDFKALDAEKILGDYNLLRTLNPQKIVVEKYPIKPTRHQYSSLIENQNATIPKKPQVKKQSQEGKMYVVKGIKSTKKPMRVDQQYLQYMGAKKEKRFIKQFHTQLNGGWRSPKTMKSPSQMKIFPAESSHKLRLNSEYHINERVSSSPGHNDFGQSKSPVNVDQRMHRIQTISEESKWRTKQFETLKQKAEVIQQQALRTIYRFASKNAKSAQYILPSSQRQHRQRRN